MLCKALSSADGLWPLEMAGKYRVIHGVAGPLVGLPLLGKVVSLALLKRLLLHVEKTGTLPSVRAFRNCSKFFREKMAIWKNRQRKTERKKGERKEPSEKTRVLLKQ